MELVITANGEIRLIYQEEVDLSTLGAACIQRASHVEPDAHGRWWADLRPVDGPILGPFEQRRLALTAEILWLRQSFMRISISIPSHPYPLKRKPHSRCTA
jgi:hypothetical protein